MGLILKGQDGDVIFVGVRPGPYFKPPDDLFGRKVVPENLLQTPPTKPHPFGIRLFDDAITHQHQHVTGGKPSMITLGLDDVHPDRWSMRAIERLNISSGPTHFRPTMAGINPVESPIGIQPSIPEGDEDIFRHHAICPTIQFARNATKRFTPRQQSVCIRLNGSHHDARPRALAGYISNQNTKLITIERGDVKKITCHLESGIEQIDHLNGP